MYAALNIWPRLNSLRDSPRVSAYTYTDRASERPSSILKTLKRLLMGYKDGRTDGRTRTDGGSEKIATAPCFAFDRLLA